MWGQGVENLVRDCLLKCIANGKINPDDETLEKIKNKYGLGGLVYQFKPCISKDLFDELLSFSKDRNELAHRAADKYLKAVLAGGDLNKIEIEMWKLEENKKIAGSLYGKLLDLHTKFSL